MRKLKLSSVALAMLAMVASAHAQQTSEVGKITVTGEGDKLGTGLIIDEDTAKAKSTVTKAELDKLRGSSNPYQALQYLPGVNATSFDATGLFGGNLRVRGFNSDQMGFTINGAPVNDSGSFSIFPQEYTDIENLCELYVTQGATDTEAPHVGASGGNIGLVTCAPEDTRRLRLSQSGGQLSYFRSFARIDTGKIGDFKGFVSYSKSEVDKWKGSGKANRDHVDAAVEYDLGKGSKLSASLLYNFAQTNNIRTLTYGSSNPVTPTLTNGKIGYYDDYSNVIPQHLTPVNGTVQNEAATASGTAYYGYSLNPFENYLLTSAGNFQLTDKLRLDVEPYYWYGYGTGGTQQTSVKEGGPLKGGVGDLNGDGDTLDTILIYRGSVTETHRPGITTKLSYALDNQSILGGFWYERARHRQTAPGTNVDNAGNIGDQFLNNSAALFRYGDGSLYENRNVNTISTGESVFLQDTIDLLDSKLRVTPGVSYRRLKRDFTNYPSGAPNPATPTTPQNFSTGAFYQFDKTYSDALPSLNTSYMFTPELQGFVGLARNFKAPGNFDYFSLGHGVTYANGVGTATGLEALTVKQETSNNIDLGFRYKNDLGKASITGFYNKFKNRIATEYDPESNTSHDLNVGDSTIKGVEVEVGTVPLAGFSAYVSGSYTKSTIDNDLQATATTVFPTNGKIFPDTPKGLAAVSLQYAQGAYLANLAAKYTTTRYITLVNDLALPRYTTVDFNAAYKIPIPEQTGLKNAVLRLNISNLLNKKYYIANSGSGSSISTNAAGAPTVYEGAPRFTSVTFQVDY